jgi:glycosyltransferase involved in cell wall biosynthesis
MAPPRVAIVVPARDPGPYLRPALESVIAQTYTGWEAIVVDDGSVEDLAWVGGIDPRVRLITQQAQGLSAARNRALAASSAPLVAFLDSDDLWEPTKLELQVAALDRDPDAALVDTQFRRIDASGRPVGAGYAGHHRSYYELLEGCGICVSTVMIRRAVLDDVGAFRPLPTVEDWDMWLRVSQRARVGLRIDQVLCSYRVHEGAMTQRYLEVFSGSTKLLWRHRREAEASGDMAALRAADVGIASARARAGRQALDGARRAWSQRRRLSTAKHLSIAAVLAPRYMTRKVGQHGGQWVRRR